MRQGPKYIVKRDAAYAYILERQHDGAYTELCRFDGSPGTARANAERVADVLNRADRG